MIGSDPVEQRATFAARLREAGASTQRFIDVHDGEKKSTVHTQREADDSRLRGNYGVYGGPGADADVTEDTRWVVDVDVDDYADTSASTEGLDFLPETFTVESPHTDGVSGGHRYYVVQGDVAGAFKEHLGIENPSPPWGEVRVSNQYCVGPGSQIEKGPDGCDKEWCDECAKPDGGHYRIADDREIAVLGVEEFVEAILTDLPDRTNDSDGGRGNADGRGGHARNVEPGPGLPNDTDVDDRFEHALENDEKLRLLWDGDFEEAGYPDDRSRAESALARELGWWFGQCPDTVRQLMDRANTRKWCTRPDESYRNSILNIVGGHDYYMPGLYEDREPVVELPEIYRPEIRWNGLRAETGATLDHGNKNPHAPTVEDLQQSTQAIIGRAMHGAGSVVIDAIMGAGKTYGAFAAAYDLAEPILYTAPRTDLYEQGVKYAKAVGFTDDEIHVLPRPDDCPTFQGDHGKEGKRHVWDLYRHGASASTIHNMLGDDLPCCADDDETPEEPLCEYRRKNQYNPREYEVIIGHYKHAHLDHVTYGRATLFDESPGDSFVTTLAGDVLIQAVNAFLSLHHSPPIKGFDNLLQARHDPERRDEALAWFNTAENGEPFDLENPDEQNVIQQAEEGYHGYGPHAVYTILASETVPDKHDLYTEDDGYEFEVAQLLGYRHKALFFASNGEFGHTDGQGYYVQIQIPPSLEQAKSVIALDGTPMLDTWTTGADDPRPAEWELALGRHLGYERVLTDTERAEFLRDMMGHTYVQTTENVRPYSSGNYNDKEKDAALLAAFSDRYLHGSPVDVTITSKRVKEEYLEDGFVDRGLTDEIVHSGEVRGSDEYAECESGAILGSSHHGDHEVARRAAWLNARVRPEHTDGDRTYGPTGDAVRDQMREQDTAQVALRIGRGKHGRGAIVAVHTSAYPGWLPVVNRENPGEVRKWPAGERAVARAVREQATADTTDGGQFTFRRQELTESMDTDIGERHLRRLLSTFTERGLLRKERDPEDGRRYVWVDTGLSSYSTDRAASVTLPDIDRGEGEHVNEKPDIPLIDSLLGKCPVNPESDEAGGSFTGPLVVSRETVVHDVLEGEELEPPA